MEADVVLPIGIEADESTHLNPVKTIGHDTKDVARIRIWDGNPGHVSLETRHIYVSFWPETCVKVEDILTPTKGVFVSYETDKRNEYRPADHIYEVSLPHFNMMHLWLAQKIEVHERKKFDWYLVGKGGFQKEAKPLQFNCATFVDQCLRKGGLRLNKPVIENGKLLLLSFFCIVLGITGIMLAKKYWPGLEVFIPSILMTTLGSVLFVSCCCYGCCHNLQEVRSHLNQRSIESPAGIKKLMEEIGAKKIDRTGANLLSNGKMISGYPNVDWPMLKGNIDVFKLMFEILYQQDLVLPEGLPDLDIFDKTYCELELLIDHFKDLEGSELADVMNAPVYLINSKILIETASNPVSDNAIHLFDNIIDSSLFQCFFDKYLFCHDIVNDMRFTNGRGNDGIPNGSVILAFIPALSFFLFNAITFLKNQFEQSEQKLYFYSPLSQKSLRLSEDLNPEDRIDVTYDDEPIVEGVGSTKPKN